jgi:polysaccharide pyruvyl transferase WcaK-like protein
MLFSDWHARFRYLGLPSRWRKELILRTYPVLFWPFPEYRKFVSRLKDARLMYYYGGTQLCWNWYDVNRAELLITMRILRKHGVPVFFGPQQYGPLRSRQVDSLKGMFRMARAVRTRNAACRSLLGLPPEALLHDEIFSNTDLYPVRETRSRKDGCVLLNIRGNMFVDRDRLAAFLGFLKAVRRRTGAPFRFFSMSGASFCDDEETCRRMKELEPSLDIGVLPRLRDEEEFFGIAREARGTISMSFHGCVLSLIGGCPPVPVTETDYYDHKYADFDRYTGRPGTPVLPLRVGDPEREADRVVRYWEEYEVGKTAGERRAAGERIRKWYAEVAGC